jgi:hypothetical protein
METTFIQSQNWCERKDLDWFIANAKFAFTSTGHKGNRTTIVTKVKLDGKNCFEFDHDQHGIIIVFCSVFNPGIYTVQSYSEFPIPMLVKFLNEWGAGAFVNPKFSIRNTVKGWLGYHKTITVQS